MTKAAPDGEIRERLLEKLSKLEDHYRELEAKLSDPEVISNTPLYTRLVKEHGSLSETIETYRELKSVRAGLADAREVLESGDEELADLARSEIEQLEKREEKLFGSLVRLFATSDREASRNVIVEIRAGTGGDEAALFAGDLYNMYTRYAERRGWKVEVMDSSPTELGGFKEITFAVTGRDVHRRLRYESGGHRVQRVPETESQGRIHTSACTVAVLPEPEDVDVEIKNEDLRIDFYHSSGPGGQKVNKTSSAVRITHEPTGIVVAIQDEKSQHKNRAKALRVLRSRLYEFYRTRAENERQSMRSNQIGSGDRSERIRTYNFPQNRVTDHRINLTLYHLDRTMDGDLDELIEPLIEYDSQQRLREMVEEEAHSK